MCIVTGGGQYKWENIELGSQTHTGPTLITASLQCSAGEQWRQRIQIHTININWSVVLRHDSRHEGLCLMFPQNTVVVERWWQVPLSKVGSPPRLHPRRHRIYKFVEDTKHAPTEKMELILTQTVPSEYLQSSQQITLTSDFRVIKGNVFKYFLFTNETCLLWQGLVGEEKLCLWKSLSAEISCCPKASQCIHHRRTNRCLLRS